MLLPSAPSDRQKYLYVKQHRAAMYGFGILSTLLLTIGSMLFAFHILAFVWYGFFVGVIVFYLAISYVIGIFARPFDLARHRAVVTLHRRYRPTIDIYLPSAGEDLDIIANTYRYVAALQRADVKVYVLDDSGRSAVEALAHQHGFAYIARPNRGELKKAGNIRYAFQQTHGDLIVIFDADFCPRPDFLDELVPYFADPKVALVQSPQFFEVKPAMSWIERGAASIQELFYRLIQTNRNTWGAAICVGTNAIYRRAALAPYGGTYPIQHSEDVHTGFNCLKDGWRIQYVPLNLAMGRCPDTLASYFTQQYRWCMGSTSLLLNRELFWGANLTPMQRLCFLSGMLYYSATALGLFLTPLPGLAMVWLSPDHVFWYNMAFSLPSFVFATIFMMWWNQEPYGLYTLKARLVSYYAHFFALKDKLTGTVMPWIPTGNAGAIRANTRVRWFRWLLAGWVSGTALLGYLGAGLHMDGWLDYDFFPFLTFLTFFTCLQLSSLWD